MRIRANRTDVKPNVFTELLYHVTKVHTVKRVSLVD